MSLVDELRDELAAIAPERGCDRLAELSGLFHTAGSVHLRGRGELAAHVDVATAAVARRAFSLLRALDVEAEIRTYRQRAFRQPTRYQLHVAGDERALAVLREAGVLGPRLEPLQAPPLRVVARRCCRGAYLRGARLGAGSLSGPRAAHLEIRSGGIEGARFLVRLAKAEGARLALVQRRHHTAAYAKGADAIVGVLAVASAGGSALALEERSVLAATRARANRVANADHANLVRVARAAHEQLDAVRALEREGRLGALPERLEEIARLRLRHPTLSLGELAARSDPPTTKASAHRRLKRVIDFARAAPGRTSGEGASKARRT